MYAKIFAQIFDSSLADDLDLRHFFMDLLILADSDGVVDMTPSAIAGRTRYPIDRVRAHLETLEKPDPESRTSDSEGRRIKRLDDHRTWGWVILNYDRFREIASDDQRKEKTRARVSRYREKDKTSPKTGTVTEALHVTPSNACNAIQIQKQIQIHKQKQDDDPPPDEAKTLLDNVCPQSSAPVRTCPQPSTPKKPKEFKCGYDAPAIWARVFKSWNHREWVWFTQHWKPFWEIANALNEKEFKDVVTRFMKTDDAYLQKRGFQPIDLLKSMGAFAPKPRIPAHLDTGGIGNGTISATPATATEPNPYFDTEPVFDDGPIPRIRADTQPGTGRHDPR